jgi:uncharacterized lipoprotein YmbA
MTTNRARHLLVALGMALLTTSCATSPPTQFYVLRPMEGPASTAVPARQLAVGVGPLSLPGYLDRPQIVSRSGTNQLELAEFDKWAEPLKDSLPKLIAANLGVLLPSERVYRYPWSASTKVDYQVTVDILAFERTTDGTCTLEARWSVIDRHTRAARATRHQRYSAQAQGADYAVTVAAMNAALGDMSRDIAATLQQQRP